MLCCKSSSKNAQFPPTMFFQKQLHDVVLELITQQPQHATENVEQFLSLLVSPNRSLAKQGAKLVSLWLMKVTIEPPEMHKKVTSLFLVRRNG